ncbi:MAG: NADH:ubiquinone oxidoreductase subunit F (NADH-binding) [Planctomycetota bacterium]|jgi:NADH:ubiquinone oxidoreductase subunit F (NADH-binding)
MDRVAVLKALRVRILWRRFSSGEPSAPFPDTNDMSDDPRASIPERLQAEGGLTPGVARKLSQESGVPEADIFGVGSFFHLLSRPNAKIRVCTGLSCLMGGANEVLEAAKAAGLPCEATSCLAGCDLPPAVLRDRRVLPSVSIEDVKRADGDWEKLDSATIEPGEEWKGHVGPPRANPDALVLDLLGPDDTSGSSYKKAVELGANGIIQAIETSGLQGRGGAGFPAHIKWRGVQGQPVTERYVVLNADEGEPGTFKDREVMLRRPYLMLEGLAIAAHAVAAKNVYLYLRGEFEIPWGIVERAIADVTERGLYDGITFHMHAGQGAYICGEETALLEALEGKRGMPRLKPPFPVEVGLWGKPTLIHNVETIACVPPIVDRGGDWFRELGREEAGTKLYCISGHIVQPGIYELPLGVTLNELVEAAGGYIGTLKAFSPGGASSGFLPASQSDLPLDFKSLGGVGSMLGSAGVVVLNDTIDMKWAALEQLRFFEAESCGQCAPCRIGTRYLREATEDNLEYGQSGGTTARGLAHVADVAWQMNEGSICGLGQAAPLPLTSALKYFSEDFKS